MSVPIPLTLTLNLTLTLTLTLSLTLTRSLAAFPDHHDSHELLKQLRTHFTML